jgi:hypothetical protein
MALKGYNLHDKRLSLFGSKKGVIRTIKYPLVPYTDSTNEPPNQEAARTEKFGEAIFHDYKHIIGHLGFEEISDHGESTHSFTELWLKALSMGIVFQASKAKTIDLARRVGEKEPEEALSPHLPKQFSDKFYPHNFFSFLEAAQRDTGEEASKEKQFLEVFKEHYRESEKKNAEEFNRYLKEEFFKSRDENALKLKKLELLGVPSPEEFLKEYEEKIKKTGPKGPLTFLILPCKPKSDSFFEIESFLRGWAKKLFSKTEEEEEKKVESLMGVSENGNALSNFGDSVLKTLREEGKNFEQLVEDCKKLAELAGTPEERVDEVLSILKTEAKRLGSPKLVSGWGDYRSEFLGKISSFYSNYVRYRKEIKESLPKLREEISELLKGDSELLKEKKSRFAALEMNLRRLSNVLKKCNDENSFAEHENYIELLRSLVARDLNELVQSEVGQANGVSKQSSSQSKRKKNEPKTVKDLYPYISKGLRSSGRFFGERRKELFDKTFKSPELYLFLRSLVTDLLVKISERVPTRQLEDKEVEQLRKWFVNCHRAGRKKEDLQHFEKSMGLNDGAFTKLLSDTKIQRVFYKNERDRNPKKSVIDTPNICLNKLVELNISALQNDPVKSFDFDRERDLVELTKTVVSFALRDLPESSCPEIQSIPEIRSILVERLENYPNLNLIPAVKSHYSILKNEGSPSLQFFLNATVLSELKGLISILSRERFILRASIQKINGEQSVIFVRDRQRRDCVKTLFGKSNINGSDQQEKVDALRADYLTRLSPNDGLAQQLGEFQIRSSKYQLQFLRWCLNKPKTKRSEIEIRGPFLIAERDCQMEIGWQEKRKKAKPVGEYRLYLSVPFSLTYKEPENGNNKAKSGNNQPLRDDRVIGIDCGEYGFAWSVVEKEKETPESPQSFKVISQGFLSDPQYRALQRKVTHLRSSQVKGTLTVSSNKVARVRESLIGLVRNRLHRELLRHRAPLVFEWQISAFETGGAKIKKVYESVKRADCYIKGNKAAENERKNIWGGKNNKTGQEVSAAFTSQICSKCKRIAKDSLSHKMTLEPNENGKDGLVRLVEGETVLNGFSENPNDCSRAVEAFARPPLHSAAAVHYEVKQLPRHAARYRGNSSLFLCPFDDCRHVADCDLQSSVIIALRYFSKASDKLQFLADLKQFEFSPVELEEKFYLPENILPNYRKKKDVKKGNPLLEAAVNRDAAQSIS